MMVMARMITGLLTVTTKMVMVLLAASNQVVSCFKAYFHYLFWLALLFLLRMFMPGLE